MIAGLRSLSLVVLALIVLCAQAIAQPAQNRRVRGTIESLDGNVLTVKTRDGSSVKINLAGNWQVTAYSKAQISDIKVGSFVGVGGVPQADGSQKAVSIKYLSRKCARARRGIPALGHGAERHHDQRERSRSGGWRGRSDPASEVQGR